MFVIWLELIFGKMFTPPFDEMNDVWDEADAMEDFESELQKDEYIPRPKWQVWGARVALVVFILMLIAYYLILLCPC